MKTRYLISLTLFVLLFVCWQTVNAQYYIDRTPILDTSRIDYEVINPQNKWIYYHLSDVNDMYFYDFDTTKAEPCTGLQSYLGRLGVVHYFENAKKYRYHISDNETFNRLLPECDFYYELTINADERVIAQYNGKFFRYEDFNYLMREMGKGELPQIAKTKILAQWRLWMFDQDVHIMSMDTVEHRIPGEKYRIKDTNDSIVYKGIYRVRFEGDIEFKGNNYRYRVLFKNDSRAIQSISIYPPGESINRKIASVRLECRDVYTQRNRSSNNNYLNIQQNGNEVDPKDQDNWDVFYYNKAAGGINVQYSNFTNLGNNTQFRLYRSIGSEEFDIPQECDFQSQVVNVTSNGASFQVSSTDISSGIYLFQYKNSSGGWDFIENVVLIPEEIDATHTIAGTNFTLELHYLEQSFDSEVDMNLYVSQMKSTFDEVMGKWIGDYQKYITPEGLVDDDNKIPLYVIFSCDDNKVTYFHKDLSENAGACYTPNYSINSSTFTFRSKYPNLLSASSPYQNIYWLLKPLIAHETFHWVEFSHSTNLMDRAYSGWLAWITEGLSVMAQAEAFPDIELNQGTKFSKFANGLLEDPPDDIMDGFIWETNKDDPQIYSLGLFFYFIHEKCGIDHIAVFKELMQKIDTHVPSEIVNDDNLYETSIENLFETALTKTNDYNNFNELLIDFVKEVYHKKAFITNTLDYSELEIPNHYEIIDDFGLIGSIKYTGMSLYKKAFVSPGNISVRCKIFPEYGKDGHHNFIISKWDANNNFIDGSLQGINLNQEPFEYTFNIDVNSGDKIIISKMNLDKTSNQADRFNVYFTADYDLVSDFSSDTQYASTGQTVQFQNESSGDNITSHYWTFEGGTPIHSTEENPSVTYNAVGSYDVSLKLTEQNGETLTETKENYINIVGEGEIVANFAADNSIINAGETVLFENLSLGEIDSYYWEFEGGEPATSSLQNPQVSYASSGLFDVKLTVSNTEGSRSMIRSNYISVYDGSSNDLICYNEQSSDKTVSFQVLYTGDDNLNDMSCTVDFGNQITEVNESSMSPFDFLHTYQDYGTYHPEVTLEIRDIYDDIIFYGGCSCPVVSLVDPDPCGDLNLNITQTPSNPAYLDEETNEIEISYTGNVTGGVPPYHWHWAFLNDEYTGVPPVGGESGGIANTTTPTHNLGSITYNSNGIYRTFLNVMDGNNCTMGITRNQEISSPDDCITDLRITYFQDYIQNQRLIIPWDDGNGNACLVNLRYEYLLNANSICSSCYDAEESSWWEYSNTESEVNYGEAMYLGQGGASSLNTDIDLSSQHDLSQGINYVRAKLQGRDFSDNPATSCYKQTTIRLIVLDCDSEMNTQDFLHNNQYTNSYSSTRGICLPANVYVEHNWREFIAGTIQLNGAANSVINEYDVMLSACNQVILEDGFETGEGRFVAQAGGIVKPCEQINYKKMSDEPEIIVDVKNSASMQVIPNPVGEMFDIKIHQPEEGQVVIKIFDAYGRLVETVFDQCISEGCYQIEVNNFNHKPGLYFCQYITNNTILTEKIIKTQNTYEF